MSIVAHASNCQMLWIARVLDNEGEFASLREAVDVLLVGERRASGKSASRGAARAPASRIQGLDSLNSGAFGNQTQQPRFAAAGVGLNK